MSIRVPVTTQSPHQYNLSLDVRLSKIVVHFLISGIAMNRKATTTKMKNRSIIHIILIGKSHKNKEPALLWSDIPYLYLTDYFFIGIGSRENSEIKLLS